MAEHLTSMSKRGVGTLSSLLKFNHERAPMYAYSDSLPSTSLKYWMKYSVQQSGHHTERQYAAISMMPDFA